MLELVLLDGTDRRFSLADGAEVTVGAAAQSVVRLHAADVSRQHAMVTCQRGRVVVLDLGSTNGTFVNGRRVKEAELRSGDAIRFSSVLAQVLPPGSAGGSGERRVRTESGAGSGDQDCETSAVIPVIMQESLVWLLARWSAVEGAAVSSLAEWLVTHRGMSAVAVLETAGSEVGVIAAHGALGSVLEDPVCLDLVSGEAPPEGTVETVQCELAGRRALAVRAPDVPWMVVITGASMPDTVEIELFTRLLAVARRLDAAPGR
ncbi:MAG: FHA domain-containing protein [Acidobacteriota bacterium]